MVDSLTEKNVHYTVESHGVLCKTQFNGGTNVSSHWIRSCLRVFKHPVTILPFSQMKHRANYS